MIAIDHPFPGMFEIHRDPVPDDGLDLAQAPVGLAGMTDQHSRFQKAVHPGAPHRCAARPTTFID